MTDAEGSAERSSSDERDEIIELQQRLAELPNAVGFAAHLNDGAIERSGLDLRSIAVARIAALAAAGAPASSWSTNLELMDGVVSADEVEGVLIAVAPIIGTARFLQAVEALIAG